MKGFIPLALFFLLLSVPYLSFPPDDDVGGHLTAARGLLEGKRIYSDYLDNKGPMLYLSLVPAVLIAGKSLAALRLIALAITVLCALLTYLSAMRCFGRQAALIACAIFFFLALDPFTEAFELRSELFIALSLSAMAYSIIESKHDERLWAGAGLALGYAVLIKPSIGILILPLLYLVPKRKAPLACLASGLLAMLCVFLLMLQAGIFRLDDYIHVSILKPSGVAGQLAGQFPFLAVLAGLLTFPLGLICLACSVFFIAYFGKLGQGAAFGALFLPLFAALILWLLSAVGVYNSLLLMFLPLASVALSLMMAKLGALVERGKIGLEFAILSPPVFAIAFAAVTIPVLLFSAWLYGPIPGQNSEGTDLTREEFDGVVSFIDSNTGANDTILAYELMPVFYYYSGREPASPALWFAPSEENVSYYSPAELDALLFGKLRAKTPKYVIIDPNGAKDAKVMAELSKTYRPEAKIGRFDIYSRR
ncbi:MAG TPA: glycosyltransferase family 39 protein [Candidatus Bilamarchaeum sp.]|nr:glycosyltransferase family 39 protein [Candidatus Bilamarchaeum sp.]